MLATSDEAPPNFLSKTHKQKNLSPELLVIRVYLDSSELLKFHLFYFSLHVPILII